MGAVEDIADNYTQTQMIGLGIASLVVPIVAVALRVWAKLLSRRKVDWDDYLICAAMACAIGCSSVQLIAAIDGQLGQHQTEGPDGQPILEDPRFVTYEKCKFAVNILSTVGLGFTKASILIFYKNIFYIGSFRIGVYIVLAIVVGWAVSFFLVNLFTCYPISPFVEAFYGSNCIDGLAMWYAMAISDIIVDFIILFMPIPLVLRLNLPLKQRLGVIAIFLLGATVCAFSISRALIYVHVGEKLSTVYNDETYYTSPVFFWATIELSTAVLSASLPTYRPIWLYLRGNPISPLNAKSRDLHRLGSHPDDMHKGHIFSGTTGSNSSRSNEKARGGDDNGDDILLTDRDLLGSALNEGRGIVGTKDIEDGIIAMHETICGSAKTCTQCRHQQGQSQASPNAMSISLPLKMKKNHPYNHYQTHVSADPYVAVVRCDPCSITVEKTLQSHSFPSRSV